MPTHLDSLHDTVLSPQQEHLLHLGADRRGATFAVEARIGIDGPLDVRCLRDALLDVARANDVLRTSFQRRDGEAIARVHPLGTVRLKRKRLEVLSPPEQERTTRSLAAGLRGSLDAPSESSANEPPRACPTLVTLGPERHELLVALPALSVDASSVQHLLVQLVNAYRARLAGECELPATSLRESLEHLRMRPSEVEHATEQAFWLERIEAAPLRARLPFDTAVPDVAADDEGFAPASLVRTLDAAACERLATLAGERGLSARSILLAAWRAYLWRVTDRAEVLLGLTCEGRALGEAFDAPGPIDGIVPLELAVTPGTPFRELAARAEEAIAGCRRAQPGFHAAWLELDDDAERRSPGYFPLGFEYRPAVAPRRVEQTTFSVRERQACTDRFDLSLLCEHGADGFELALRYDAYRLSADQVEPLLAGFETLLTNALAHPEREVDRLRVLTLAERLRILEEFNATGGQSPPEPLVHEQIALRARQNPAAPAVLFEDEVLTHDELERRSNRLARRLRELGVTRNVLVAIHAEPCFEMLVGLLGVLKAGGAYVPLDPENPAERHRFVLEDTGAPVVLTLHRLADLPVPQGVQVLELDADWPSVALESDAPLDPIAGPDDLAYSIYTSGSTGQPKGVLVTHANLRHSTWARQRYYGEPVERFLLLSSFAFDSSVAGLFWSLVDGGALVLPSAGTQRDPRLIGELMQRQRVTHSLCLASHWALILAHARPEAFASLRTAIVSGEVFARPFVERHDERAPGARLFNEYGPTEGSVWSTVFDCHEPFPGTQVPMGRPIANTSIHLLDEHMEPVPVGVPGEMYQGGDGVTVGYLNRPERTAAAFVPDPYAVVGTHGEEPRLYRTGDRARYLSDGSIEFLGRVDHQVKLRGYRIEPGEIEAVLCESEELREVAVVCREDEPGERYLAAYFVCRPGESVVATTLRERLEARLPAYMIPSAFQELEDLPRTTIGKLDTERLPVPAGDRDGLHARYVAPRTPLEAWIAGIWSDVLDRAPIGVEDDYFELGGHSLLATRIVHQLRESLSEELALRTIFDAPTVAGLAAAILAGSEEPERVERTAQRLVAMAELSEEDLEHLLEDRRQNA